MPAKKYHVEYVAYKPSQPENDDVVLTTKVVTARGISYVKQFTIRTAFRCGLFVRRYNCIEEETHHVDD